MLIQANTHQQVALPSGKAGRVWVESISCESNSAVVRWDADQGRRSAAFTVTARDFKTSDINGWKVLSR